MSASDYFDLDLQEDGIARLTLNQPARMNTMAPDFFPAFRDAIQRLHDEGASGVAIVVGPLYLGGRLRGRETIDEAGEAERRWAQSALSSCWVSGPAPGCC